jgi:hypothetical protein
MSLSWEGVFAYAFPLFIFLAPVLHKITGEKCRIIDIAPTAKALGSGTGETKVVTLKFRLVANRSILKNYRLKDCLMKFPLCDRVSPGISSSQSDPIYRRFPSGMGNLSGGSNTRELRRPSSCEN